MLCDSGHLHDYLCRSPFANMHVMFVSIFRPKSPHMNNEEAINLSHYPDGRKPEENEEKKAPIERDDCPGSLSYLSYLP